VAHQVAPEVSLTAWCVRGTCTDTSKEKPSKLEVDAPEVTLRFALTDKGSGIGNLVVKRQSATVASRGLTRSETLQSAAGGPRMAEQLVALEPGENQVVVTAFDASQSLDAGAAVQLPILFKTSAPALPDLYIVSIGIDQYASPNLNALRNAANDARGVAERMAQNPHGLFREANTTLLLNGQARLADIKESLRRVALKAKPQDMVVVFLAGHGITIDKTYYFLPQDVEISESGIDEKFKATALPQEDFSGLLSALPSSRVAVLIDSCNSGAFAVPNSVLRQNQDRTWSGAIGHDTGRFVLAGTSDEQEALDGINGHGIFTTVLLDGLNGLADQEVRGNNNKEVDVVEISEYTRQKVPVAADNLVKGHRQNVVGFFAGFDYFSLSRLQP
jgi:hypothetical protein